MSFGNKIGIPSANNVSHSDIRVSNLIDYDKGVWDVNALSQWFDTDTVSATLAIPLSSDWLQDKLYWWYTRNGEYSIKSGYWLSLLRNHSNDVAPMDDTLHKLWARLWNIPAPPKLYHFICRTCKGSLAIKQVLYNRYCVDSLTCDRCNTDSESVFHALCDCQNIVSIWSYSPAAATLRDAPRTSMIDFLN